MYLKFIGENGSMGLLRGSIYKVKVISENNNIWVWWRFGKGCPYASPKSFAENWAKP